MEWYLSVSFGELTLKGKNRHLFEQNAMHKILKSIKDYPVEKHYQDMGKFYIKSDKEYFPDMIQKIRRVFGIVYISPCIRCDKNMNSIGKAAVEILQEEPLIQKKTFKVRANRVDKSFPLNSMQVAAQLGGILLKQFDPYLSVDVHHPELEVFVDIKQNAYVYTTRIKAYGGLPIDSSSKGLLLLSGGIDSPVAGFLMAKRGVEVSCLHFHSYPYTSKRGYEKVKQLAEELSFYTGKITMYSINLLPIYQSIAENCKERNTTILSRRFMMKIGNILCEKYGIQAMITGENLGQVASQTIQGISVINAVSTVPILRPLIAMEKTKIIEIAREIGTYDTSILPYDDCCSIFTPKRPVTKPRLKDIELDEQNLDSPALIEQVMSNMEIIECGE